jgi:hypothetical protein
VQTLLYCTELAQVYHLSFSVSLANLLIIKHKVKLGLVGMVAAFYTVRVELFDLLTGAYRMARRASTKTQSVNVTPVDVTPVTVDVTPVTVDVTPVDVTPAVHTSVEIPGNPEKEEKVCTAESGFDYSAVKAWSAEQFLTEQTNALQRGAAWLRFTTWNALGNHGGPSKADVIAMSHADLDRAFPTVFAEICGASLKKTGIAHTKTLDRLGKLVTDTFPQVKNASCRFTSKDRELKPGKAFNDRQAVHLQMRGETDSKGETERHQVAMFWSFGSETDDILDPVKPFDPIPGGDTGLPEQTAPVHHDTKEEPESLADQIAKKNADNLVAARLEIAGLKTRVNLDYAGWVSHMAYQTGAYFSEHYADQFADLTD